jgi:nitrite reductase (cytochrome c-552)
MPFQNDGGQKYTNHKMQSPLNNIAASCQVCHREETATLVKNVYDRQDKVLEARHLLEKVLVRAHGGSFHAPLECGRIIAAGLEIAQDARIRLARLLASFGYNQEVPYPDISTKAKAQEYIGLDMKKFNAEKTVFLNEIVPQWKKAAAERESKWN